MLGDHSVELQPKLHHKAHCLSFHLHLKMLQHLEPLIHFKMLQMRRLFLQEQVLLVGRFQHQNLLEHLKFRNRIMLEIHIHHLGHIPVNYMFMRFMQIILIVLMFMDQMFQTSTN